MSGFIKRTVLSMVASKLERMAHRGHNPIASALLREVNRRLGRHGHYGHPGGYGHPGAYGHYGHGPTYGHHGHYRQHGHYRFRGHYRRR